MISEIGGSIPNPFLNLNLWQNYLTYWIEASRNFYENAIRTNEQWLKAIWEPWLNVINPSQRQKVRIE
jgi:hypothetical protein